MHFFYKTLLRPWMLMALVPLIADAQTQKGLDIDGETAGDWSGYSVSMPDANTIAIGEVYNDDVGSDAGQVRVHKWNGSAWVQKGAHINGTGVFDVLGFSVSMPDSNTLAIGVPYSDGGGTDAGHVEVYRWNGTAWIQKGTNIFGEAAGDLFGYCVSMPDSNSIAIGAPRNSDAGTYAGHVRIFQWTGSTWLQLGSDIDGAAAGIGFGYGVSMPDPTTLGVGAPYDDDAGTDAGHARVFHWNGTSWVQLGGDVDGEGAGDNLGWSLSMPDSITLAVGAPLNDGSGSDAGHVRIYRWNGTFWTQKGTDLDGASSGDRSGYSISMPDSNTIAIGADGGGATTGQCRLYSWTGSAWVQSGTDIDGEATGDYAGFSVSMPDPNTVAVGAIGNNFSTGHTRVFVLSAVGMNHSLFTGDVQIYPIPATDDLILDAGLKADGLEYSLFDLAGNMVTSGRLSYGQNRLSLDELPAGLYLIRIGVGDFARVSIVKP